MTTEVKERLRNIKWMLKNYQNTHLEDEDRPRPCIVWSDGSDLGMGWAAHASGDPGGFKVLGLKGYEEFYKMPLKRRNEQLSKRLKIFNEIFPTNLSKYSKKQLETKEDFLLKNLKKIKKGNNSSKYS